MSEADRARAQFLQVLEETQRVYLEEQKRKAAIAERRRVADAQAAHDATVNRMLGLIEGRITPARRKRAGRRKR